MKRKMKFSGGLYKFLDRSGVLVSGDDTAIKAAKREYWRLYKKNWRMNQKTINKAFTVVLSIEDYEWLGASAKAHKRTINNFLKQAAICYLQQKYLVPDIILVKEIQGLLIKIYTGIQKMLDENLLEFKETRVLLDRVAEIEKLIHGALQEPKKVSE
jgi:hypothetical protein